MNKRLCLRDSQGRIYLNLQDIVRFEADDCYTIIHMLGGRKHVQSGSLIKFEERVKPEGLFFRIHRSHLVNLLYVYRVDDGGSLTMMDGTVLPITEEAKKRIGGDMPSL